MNQLMRLRIIMDQVTLLTTTKHRLCRQPMPNRHDVRDMRSRNQGCTDF